MKPILITAAAGDTGRPTTELLLEKGFRVSALVRKDDGRAQRLRESGAEVGTDKVGTAIIGRPLKTIEQFLAEKRSNLLLPYLKQPPSVGDLAGSA
ncbi:MAG TPA: NmrA family NAD(P)-binding protein [Chthoniobacterales bacterium]